MDEQMQDQAEIQKGGLKQQDPNYAHLALTLELQILAHIQKRIPAHPHHLDSGSPNAVKDIVSCINV
jgi:hypothetical protein